MQLSLQDKFQNYTHRRSFRNHARINDKKQANSNIWKRWRPFYATDFQSLMYPCFTFCRILGIFPYRINNSTFEASKSCNIVSTIVICIFGVYGIIILYEIHISGTLQYVNTTKSLERHCYFILSGTGTIITYILRGPRLLLLQTILEISSKLPSESYKKLSRLIHVKDIIGFLSLITVALICNWINMTLKSILVIPFAMYLSLLMFLMDMFYVNCVCVLKICFKEINDNLAQMQKLVISDKPHLLRRIYHEQKNPFLLIKLKALKEQHLMVSDTVQMLNTIFSQQIIVTIVMIFAEITFNLYFYIVIFMEKEKVDFWYLYFILCLIYYTTKIVLIVWACDSGKEQAAKIGITVHDLLNNVSDKQIKDELKLFSMQILHRENAFSAKGLTVDATLLTAMVGSITTYLLILIQFFITSVTCDEKTMGANNGSEHKN